MTFYRYQSPSLIDEVRLVTNASGGHRAYLHARSDATPEQLGDIKRRLTNMGYQCVPISDQGKALLEVRGFEKPEEFMAYLANHDWVSGKPEVAKLKSDTVSRKEKFSNLTLKLAGFVYLLSDFCYMKYATMGLKDEEKKLSTLLTRPNVKDFDKIISTQKEAIKGEKFNIGAGLGYAMGSASLAFFGNKDQSQTQIRNASKKIHSFAIHDGIHIDPNAAIESNSKKEKKGLLGRAGDFARRYPSEILNAVYIGVGALITSRSIKKIASLRARGEGIREDVIDTGLGVVTAASALAGLAIKEKKREPGETRRHGLAGVWDWIQEKPLRATGYGYMISTMFHAAATIGKYRKGDPGIRKTIGWRGGFVAGNVISEILVAISSKGHGEGVKTDHSTDDTIIATTAELIARQNPARQNQLIEQCAGYMAAPEVLGGKAEKIASRLREQVAAIQQNPWAEAKEANPHHPAPLVAMTPPKTTISANTIDTAARAPLKPLEHLDASASVGIGA